MVLKGVFRVRGWFFVIVEGVVAEMLKKCWQRGYMDVCVKVPEKVFFW